jgi:hypothetical protein
LWCEAELVGEGYEFVGCPERFAGLAGCPCVGVDFEGWSSDEFAGGVSGVDGVLAAGGAGCGDVFVGFGVEEVEDVFAPLVDGGGDFVDVWGVLWAPPGFGEVVESLWCCSALG